MCCCPLHEAMVIVYLRFNVLDPTLGHFLKDIHIKTQNNPETHRLYFHLGHYEVLRLHLCQLAPDVARMYESFV